MGRLTTEADQAEAVIFPAIVAGVECPCGRASGRNANYWQRGLTCRPPGKGHGDGGGGCGGGGDGTVGEKGNTGEGEHRIEEVGMDWNPGGLR